MALQMWSSMQWHVMQLAGRHSSLGWSCYMLEFRCAKRTLADDKKWHGKNSMNAYEETRSQFSAWHGMIYWHHAICRHNPSLAAALLGQADLIAMPAIREQRKKSGSRDSCGKPPSGLTDFCSSNPPGFAWKTACFVRFVEPKNAQFDQPRFSRDEIRESYELPFGSEAFVNPWNIPSSIINYQRQSSKVKGDSHVENWFNQKLLGLRVRMFVYKL